MDSPYYEDFPPLPPLEPPAWFGPVEAQYMTGAQWQEYYARLNGYLLAAVSAVTLTQLDRLRVRAITGKLGGPLDGSFGQGWAWHG